jgi:hypothetical protein
VAVQVFSSVSKRRNASRHFGNMLRLEECSSLVPKIESGGVFDAAEAAGAKALARKIMAPARAAEMTQMRRWRRMNGGQEIIASLDSVFLEWPEFLDFRRYAQPLNARLISRFRPVAI